MAQNITLLGASYSDVPAVELPKTGGGTATFTDTSPTTATESDVASGKIFYLADGSQATGTASGGGGGGQYDATIESGVIFIDYDGNIVEEWETSTVAGKTALPSNPSHTGLTAQGWNYALTDIKSYISSYPSALLPVGQMYTTTSGATEIDITLTSNLLHPYLGISPNGTVSVDWGDGSTASTLTGTSLTSTKWANHTYSAAGDYTIKLTVSSGSFAFYNSSQSNGGVLQASGAWTNNRSYSGTIQAIRIGNGAKIGNYAFPNCYNMQYITVPSSVSMSGTYLFNNCFGLTAIIFSTGTTSIGGNCALYIYCCKYISLPKGITSLGTYAFANGGRLRCAPIPQGVTSLGTYAFSAAGACVNATIPNSITTISSYAFYNNSLMPRITIPSSVTTIQANAFAGLRSAVKIRFERSSPPSVSASSAFTNLNTACVISVPVGSLSAYKSASNYPSSSTYTYIEEA